MQYTQQIFEFIKEHYNDDVSKMRLKYHGVVGDIDYNFAITQIECRHKYGKKLSKTLSKYDDFVFPDTLAGEQCTSDTLANFHSMLIKDGECVCDLTTGLGIDCFHVAAKALKVISIERKPQLVEALQHNALGLGCLNVEAINGDSCEMLLAGNLSGDVAFIDPARRSQSGGRVYALSDCEPNVVEMLPTLSRYFKRLVVKMSPMLDVTQTLRELPGTTDVYAIGTRAECKELVAVVDLSGTLHEAKVHAVTVNSDNSYSDFVYSISEENGAPTPIYADINRGDFVYELSPAVMKAAPLRLISERYGLHKFHANTHVYFSHDLKIDVPAEVWQVEEIIPWQSKMIKRVKNMYAKMEIAVRNFGMSADALRTKLAVKQGGDYRLLGVTDKNENRLMLILKKP